MRLAISKPICLAFLLGVVGVCQTKPKPSSALAEVRFWIDKATQTGDPVAWAADLMKADAAAEKLEQTKESGCCGVRCIHIGDFDLHYRFNEPAGKEFYQHDLLQTIATVHIGSKDGADALVRLLPTGCETISNRWIPLFRTVLGIVEQKRWRDLADLRLTEIRGEAYETWWSLSKMSNDDVFVTDAQMSPEDFADGAAIARERAIESYETLVKAHRAGPDILQRLAKLRARQDTQMRDWICFSD